MIAVSQCLTKLCLWQMLSMWSFNQTELPLSYFCVLCDTRHWKPAQQQYASGGKAEYLQTFTAIYYKAIPLTSQNDFTRTDTDHSASSAKLTGRVNSALLVHVYSVMPFFFFFVNAIPKAKRFLFKAAFFLLLFSWGVGARKGRVLRHHHRISRTFGTNELNLRVPHYLVLLI